jgi:hypothetical protein
MWNFPAFLNQTSAPSSTSSLLCVVGHCDLGESHHCLEDRYFFWWPDTDCSVVQYISALTVLQEAYQQHTWVPDNGGRHFDSRGCHLKLLPVHGQWFTGRIHISSPLTTQFRQLFPCIA